MLQSHFPIHSESEITTWASSQGARVASSQGVLEVLDFIPFVTPIAGAESLLEASGELTSVCWECPTRVQLDLGSGTFRANLSIGYPKSPRALRQLCTMRCSENPRTRSIPENTNVRKENICEVAWVQWLNILGRYKRPYGYQALCLLKQELRDLQMYPFRWSSRGDSCSLLSLDMYTSGTTS